MQILESQSRFFVTFRPKLKLGKTRKASPNSLQNLLLGSKLSNTQTRKIHVNRYEEIGDLKSEEHLQTAKDPRENRPTPINSYTEDIPLKDMAKPKKILKLASNSNFEKKMDLKALQLRYITPKEKRILIPNLGMVNTLNPKCAGSDHCGSQDSKSSRFEKIVKSAKNKISNLKLKMLSRNHIPNACSNEDLSKGQNRSPLKVENGHHFKKGRSSEQFRSKERSSRPSVISSQQSHRVLRLEIQQKNSLISSSRNMRSELYQSNLNTLENKLISSVRRGRKNNRDSLSRISTGIFHRRKGREGVKNTEVSPSNDSQAISCYQTKSSFKVPKCELLSPHPDSMSTLTRDLKAKKSMNKSCRITEKHPRKQSDLRRLIQKRVVRIIEGKK